MSRKAAMPWMMAVRIDATPLTMAIRIPPMARKRDWICTRRVLVWSASARRRAGGGGHGVGVVRETYARYDGAHVGGFCVVYWVFWLSVWIAVMYAYVCMRALFRHCCELVCV